MGFNLGYFCWFYCCFSFTMQPYWFHLKSKRWTVAVQPTEVTSCCRVRLCCQFYEHNYLTSDAAKDWFVKIVAGWTFSGYSSVRRGRCLGSGWSDFGYVTLETRTQAWVDRLRHYRHHYHSHPCANPLWRGLAAGRAAAVLTSRCLVACAAVAAFCPRLQQLWRCKGNAALFLPHVQNKKMLCLFVRPFLFVENLISYCLENGAWF